MAEASNDVKALELYEKVRLDFVTLDITMHQLNSLTVLKSLPSTDPQARVVIVSAVGQKQVGFQALAQGDKDFVVKPFEPERVVRAMNRLFA